SPVRPQGIARLRPVRRRPVRHRRTPTRRADGVPPPWRGTVHAGGGRRADGVRGPGRPGGPAGRGFDRPPTRGHLRGTRTHRPRPARRDRATAVRRWYAARPVVPARLPPPRGGTGRSRRPVG